MEHLASHRAKLLDPGWLRIKDVRTVSSLGDQRIHMMQILFICENLGSYRNAGDEALVPEASTPAL